MQFFLSNFLFLYKWNGNVLAICVWFSQFRWKFRQLFSLPIIWTIIFPSFANPHSKKVICRIETYFCRIACIWRTFSYKLVEQQRWFQSNDFVCRLQSRTYNANYVVPFGKMPTPKSTMKIVGCIQSKDWKSMRRVRAIVYIISTNGKKTTKQDKR